MDFQTLYNDQVNFIMTTNSSHYHINLDQTLQQYLNRVLKQVFVDLDFDQKFAKILLSSRPDLGQFQCNAAMVLAKKHHTAPIKIANAIADKLRANQLFKEITTIAPGFINISLSDAFLVEWTNQMLKSKRLGVPTVKTPRKVVMDFGGPNIAKPLHIGHLRSPLIGDCLQRVYSFCGDNVISDVHLGDWGTQMGMLIEAIREIDPDLPYFDKKFSGDYPQQSPVTVEELSEIYPKASLNCKQNNNAMDKARLATFELQQGRRGYRALWQHFVDISVKELKKDYASLGVYFDLWKGESDAQKIIGPMVEKLLKAGVAQKSQGATIIEVANNENDNTPPLILIKSDGAVMYGTTDLATILERAQDYDAQKIIYVVDKRQSLHFKQVFAAAQKSNIATGVELTHIGFGTVNGKDGKPFKTREGGVMRLSTLIDQAKQYASLKNQTNMADQERKSTIDSIALATVKFADLSNLYASDYIFDLDKFSRYEGKTGPYLLYSAVRIKSILRNINQGESHSIGTASNAPERDLQLALSGLSNAIFNTYENCQPHHLCEYAYQVATKFNQFYASSPVANETNAEIQASRIALCKLTLKVLEQVLGLLGISIPEKM